MLFIQTEKLLPQFETYNKHCKLYPGKIRITYILPKSFTCILKTLSLLNVESEGVNNFQNDCGFIIVCGIPIFLDFTGIGLGEP